MLVHPFATCRDVWSRVLPWLERDHEVFSLAIPGHIDADPVPAGAAPTLSSMVDVLEAKLDQLGVSRAHIVGNSLGGWIAIELARRQRALSIVAIAPGGGWRLGGAAHRRLLRKFKILHAMLRVGGPFAPLLSKSSVSRALCLRDAVAKPEQLTTVEARRLMDAAFRCEIFGEALRVLKTHPLSDPFTPPCRMRFAWGEKDRLLPMVDYSEHWRRAFPSAEWVILKGVGHVPMYDDPEAVARCILEVTHVA